MKNFKPRGGQGGFGPGRRGFSKPNFVSNSGRRDRGPVTMHSAICAECGSRCEVPFRPTGDKPVYCSNCFGEKRDGGSDRAPRRDFDRPSFQKNDNNEVKHELENISFKLDQLIRSIEKLAEKSAEPKVAKMATSEEAAPKKKPAAKKTKKS